MTVSPNDETTETNGIIGTKNQILDGVVKKPPAAVFFYKDSSLFLAMPAALDFGKLRIKRS